MMDNEQMDNEQMERLMLELIDLAEMVAPEAEGIDLTDRAFSLEDLVRLRSHLSSWRKAIDILNKALAAYWDDQYKGERITVGATEWSLGRAKTRRLTDKDMFMSWVASRTTEELERLFNPNRLAGLIKTTGMTPAEVDTHIISEYTAAGLTIQNKPTTEKKETEK